MITPSYGLTATERVLPKLALDWTTGIAQSGVDVVRAGVATFVGANGLIQSSSANTQRIDYSTGVAGLLVEESRTNLSLDSEDFSTGSYTNINATISTNTAETTAPDGTNTADKYILPDGVVTGSSTIRQGFIKSATAITYTLSVFCKKAENNTIRLFVRDTVVAANTASANFNLATKTIATAAAVSGTFTNASATITELANDWFRVTLTFTTGIEIGINYRLFQLLNNANTTGNDVNGIYLWGAQLEAGAFSTSYIPTEALAVTRNADVATMTGTNFSDWFNASEGAFAIQSNISTITSNQCLLSVNDNTSSNRLRFVTLSATVVRLSSITAGVVDGAIDKTVAAGEIYLCGAYKLNNNAFATNGGATSVDTSVAVPTFSQLSIGSDRGLTVMSGIVEKIMYYSQRLINAEVQAFSK